MRLPPPCWSDSDASNLLKTTALKGSERAFLATHVPIERLTTTQRASHVAPGQATEQDVFRVLRDSTSDVFCVVRGDPGCGKSHFIRWMSARSWRDDDYTILVPRAGGSLIGTIQILRKRLPPELRRLLPDFDDRVDNVTRAGHIADFVAKLANAFDSRNLTAQLTDGSWCDTSGISNLFRHPDVATDWRAPGRILDIVSGRGADGQSTRDSAMADFVVEDLRDLVQMRLRFPNRGPERETYEALNRDFETILGAIQAAPDEEGRRAWLEQHGRDTVSLRLLNALNAPERRNHALRGYVPGTSSDHLLRVFGKLREHLHGEGRRLVLLLEDITNFQGIDDRLVDGLVMDSAENDGLCPMISVVGITTYYYGKYLGQGNYQDRVGLLVDFPADAADRAQGVTATQEGRLRFATTYMNAVRVGADGVDATPEAERVRNACDSCARREACHAAFGTYDGVGLYPFTRTAIDRIYGSLRDKAGRSNPRTPRGFLQHVLAPTLTRPKELEDGGYPHADAVAGHYHGQRYLDQADQAQILRVDESDRARLGRFLAWWGSDRPGTVLIDGEPCYSGVPKVAFEMLGLPWVGGTPSSARSSAPIVDPVRPDPKSVREVTEERPVPTRRDTSAVDNLRAEIRAWRDGDDLRNAAKWIARLVHAVHELSWENHGFPRWVVGAVFTKSTVMLQGGGQPRQINLKRYQWLATGLEAIAIVELDARKRSHIDMARNWRHIAGFKRNLARFVRDEIQHALGGWSPTRALVRVTLVRCWLAGRVSPDASPLEQWTTVSEALRSSSGRYLPGWVVTFRRSDWSDLCAPGDERRDRVSVPDKLHLDAWTAAIAREVIADPLRCPGDPRAKRLPRQLHTLRTLEADLNARLEAVVANEVDRIVDVVGSISEECGDVSIREHLEEVGATVDDFDQQAQGNVSSPIRAWRNATEVPLARDVLDGVRTLRRDVLRGRVPDSIVSRIAWCTRLSGADLQEVWRRVEQAQAVVEAISTFVNGIPSEFEGVDLQALQAAGAAISGSADAALGALEES